MKPSMLVLLLATASLGCSGEWSKLFGGQSDKVTHSEAPPSDTKHRHKHATPTTDGSTNTPAPVAATTPSIPSTTGSKAAGADRMSALPGTTVKLPHGYSEDDPYVGRFIPPPGYHSKLGYTYKKKRIGDYFYCTKDWRPTHYTYMPEWQSWEAPGTGTIIMKAPSPQKRITIIVHEVVWKRQKTTAGGSTVIQDYEPFYYPAAWDAARKVYVYTNFRGQQISVPISD